MIIALTDIETTGVSLKDAEIIEIGLVLFDSETFKIIDTMDVKVMPDYPMSGDPNAYAINGFTLGEWKGAISLRKAMKMYAEKTKGAVFCAHNMIFDWIFLDKAATLTKNPLSFDYHKIDIFSLAFAKIPPQSPMYLSSICEYLGIAPEVRPHRAFNGAKIEYEVYKKLMQKI